MSAALRLMAPIMQRWTWVGVAILSMPTVDQSEAAAQLRDAERKARAVLAQACAKDLESSGQFFSRPLNNAKAELEAFVFSLGQLDAMLGQNIVIEQAQKSAVRCARTVFANADVRFRARFRIYAAELTEAERQFEEVAGKAAGVRRLRQRRTIAIPHIEFNEGALRIPHCELLRSGLELWLEELEKTVLAELTRGVESARRAILRRGCASLARVRMAVHLRSRGVPVL